MTSVSALWPASRPVALALLLAAAGGTVFFYLGTPLPWMIGALCATTAASLAGAPVRVPGGMRLVMLTVLGVMLGSAFRPELLDRLTQWSGSLATLLVYIVIISAALAFLLHRAAGMEPVTAFFSAAPGGMNEMIAVGGAMGGDEKTISLMQSLRLLITVLAIPFGFRLFEGYDPSSSARAMSDLPTVMPVDAVVLALCAVVGYYAAGRARLPAPALTGPMALSALVHLTGTTAASPPGVLIGLAQVVIGASVGCRFAGVTLERVRATLMKAALSTGLMLALAVVFALVLADVTGLAFSALLLAFTPGGLAEMCLVSLALGIDAAFVSTHHVVRIFFIVICVPIAFRLLAGRLGIMPADRRQQLD